MYSSRSPLRPTTIVEAMLISQSPNTIANPIRAISTTVWNIFTCTPWLIPPRTSAGSARLAAASSPLSTSPTTSAIAIGFSSLRRVNEVSPARACSMLTFGSSLTGGSAATLASSSGLGGTDPIIPSMWVAPARPARPPMARTAAAPPTPGVAVSARAAARSEVFCDEERSRVSRSA